MMMSDSPCVMVIDDNRALAENIKEILEEEDIHVEVADDGLQALDRLAQADFDLVITDVRMPGLDGVQVLKNIHERWPGLPVVVMTAYSSDSSLEEAAASGALGILSKPLDIQRVLEMIRRVAEPKAPVLLLEDDRGLRINLSEALLEIADAVPYSAPDLATAERLVTEIPFRMAIIDARLPDGSGLDYGRRLQEQHPDMRIIYITGFAEELSAELGKLLHGSSSMHLLEKPFSPAKLLQIVQSVI